MRKLILITILLLIFQKIGVAAEQGATTFRGNVGVGTTNLTGGALTVMSGNVGIGTWSPTSKLQVVGSIAATNFSGTSSGTNTGDQDISGKQNIASLEGDVEAIVDLQDLQGAVTDAQVPNNITITESDPQVGAVTNTKWCRANGTSVECDQDAPAGAAAWGSITGTLSDQTDLQNALNAKAPLASPSFTGNVGIGTTAVGGLAVMSGNVGIGTWSPTSALQVVGTVAATSFTGDGSALTGIGAGGWTDGGTNVYTATTTDNVGIGTTTPTASLNIVKSGSNVPLMISSTPGGAGNYLIVNSGGAVGIGTTLVSTDALAIRSPAADGNAQSLKVYSNATSTSMFLLDEPAAGKARLRLRDTGTAEVTFDTNSGVHSITGSVGIGTASPTGALNVVGDELRVGSGGTNTNATSAGEAYVQGDLEVDGTIYGDGSQLTGIAAGGWVDGGTNIYASPTTDNVAIGTTTPTQKLTVVGTITATAFTGDGSGLTGLSAGGWTDNGASVIPTTTSDQISIGTTTPVAGAALTVLGTIAGSGSGPLSITNGNVGIGTFATPTVLLHVGNTAGSPGSVGANDVYIQNDLEVDGTVYMGSCSGAGCGGTSGWTTDSSTKTTSTYNVGIGTTSPERPLSLSGSSPDIRIRGSANNEFSEMQFWTDSGESFNFGVGGSAVTRPNQAYFENLISGAPIDFYTAGGSLTLTGSGNVGIGSTAPNGSLDIRNTTSSIGWSIQNAANQACNTTCTAGCVFGMNTGALGNFLPCTDATADTCLCAGSN